MTRWSRRGAPAGWCGGAGGLAAGGAGRLGAAPGRRGGRLPAGLGPVAAAGDRSPGPPDDRSVSSLTQKPAQLAKSNRHGEVLGN
jgi:hypothetical protein